MAVALVRQETVAVEELRAGDKIILPVSGRRVTVERVDEFDDSLIVRWWRPAERGEPGHRGGKQHAEAIGDCWNGRYYGSLELKQPGETVTVDRG